MKKYWIIIGLLIFMMGCSVRPEYESKDNIINIVHKNYGSDYQLVKSLSYKDGTAENNMEYEYIFENSKGNSFSMYTYSRHVAIDASVTSFYGKMISDNYVTSKITKQYDKIKKIFDDSKIKYEFINKDKSNYTINFYLKNIEEINKLSDILYEVNKLIDFEKNLNMDSGIYKISDYVRVNIYLEPKKNLGYGNNAYASYDLKYGIEKEKMQNSIKQDLLSYIYENGGENKENFDISTSQLTDFKVNKVIYELDRFKTITFYLDKTTNDYYTSDIGICLNYDIYSYNHNESFELLVKKIGGSFKKDGWKSSWSIGNNRWDAELKVNSKNEYQDLIVKKNGIKLDLKYYNQYQNSIFQQHFTRKTLEEMLNANINISQNGEVTITSR